MTDNIEMFLKKARKEFENNNVVFTLNDWEPENVNVIPTGSLSLDLALGVGGLPRGRVSELYGIDGAGKTTLCLHIIAEAQKQDLNVLFVDMENAVDINYARAIGVNVEAVYWSQPSYMEEALGVIEGAIESGSFGLIILDSVASLAPLKEQEDDLESANVALTPRALTKFFRRNQYRLRNNDTCLLLTNQVRDNIGSYFGGTYTPGGHALKHARSIAMYIRRQQDIKVGGEIVGHTAEIVIKKNKVAPPFKEATFDIIYGKGIDPYRDILEVAKNLGVVILRGSYYTYNGENIGQGKEAASSSLEENEELFNEIREECFNV